MVKSTNTMSRKASRTFINRHHQLEKLCKQATARGDISKAEDLRKEIHELGGLNRYQQASLQGQSLDRGGDTSKLLLDWIPMQALKAPRTRPRLLEVGALSTKNACSTSGRFDVVHIDLNSQEPGIEKQDFMERPLPSGPEDYFDVISLSLVLNFVPDHIGRGRMLLRTLSFLRQPSSTSATIAGETYPLLFLVLPKSCIDNSRYFTDALLSELMAELGYTRLKSKLTQKLAYTLWHWDGRTTGPSRAFKKHEVNPGRSRNNFVITL